MNRRHWIIKLVLVALLGGSAIAQVEQDADAIADRYLTAMQRKGYSFLSTDELLHRRDQIAAFTVEHLREPLDRSTRVAMLDGIDRCLDRLYYIAAGTVYYAPGSGSGGEEWMYLNDRDYFLTFQYHLWVALMRQPLGPADVERRETQQNWMRQYLTNLPYRVQEPPPHEEMRNEEVRLWALAELEKAFADPMHLLAEPMPDAGFAELQDRFKQYSHGIGADFHYMELAALTSRFISREDPEGRYGYTYTGQHPFNDTVVDLWASGPSLYFASNADFRGNHAWLGGSEVFDVVRCVEMDPDPDTAPGSAAMDAWLAREGRGDLLAPDKSELIAVRGARIANLAVNNWFEADKLPDDQLRAVIRNCGTDEISITGLPPVNGPHRGDRSEGEFFIVVQTGDNRLAVVCLNNYEFGGLMFWCRPRGATIPKDEELYQRLDEVVHYIWDPIGVSNYPEARDEYHSYLPEIYARVKIGEKDHLLEYMKWVVTDQMGMVFDREKAEEAADIMLIWKDVILKNGITNKSSQMTAERQTATHGCSEPLLRGLLGIAFGGCCLRDTPDLSVESDGAE